MTDFLIVSFDKNEKTNDVGICVARQTKETFQLPVNATTIPETKLEVICKTVVI